MPYITEAIYRGLFADRQGCTSVHKATWPQAETHWQTEASEAVGDALLAVAGAVRRYKSSRQQALGAAIPRLLVCASGQQRLHLRGAEADIASVARADCVEIVDVLAADVGIVAEAEGIKIAV